MVARPIVAEICGIDEEDEANARLIAAAPEMLEALKALVDLLELDDEGTRPGTDTWVALNRAEILIDKAEGRQ